MPGVLTYRTDRQTDRRPFPGAAKKQALVTGGRAGGLGAPSHSSGLAVRTCYRHVCGSGECGPNMGQRRCPWPGQSPKRLTREYAVSSPHREFRSQELAASLGQDRGPWPARC